MPLIYESLHQSCATLGTILFTITRLDPAAGVVWRDYTSHPVEYPAQGTKPLDKDEWYDACITAQKTFVANTPEGFSAHFFDAALIISMGLGSVINIPVADDAGEVRLTVNLLAGPGHYTAERVAEYERLVEAARGELIRAIQSSSMVELEFGVERHMKFTPKPTDLVKQHLQPLRRPSHTTLLAAYVETENNGRRMWEQLWTEEVAENEYEICCIPFYTHGLALGDIVCRNEDFAVKAVLRVSGNRTFRAILQMQGVDETLKVLDQLKIVGGEWEFYNENFVALSVPETAYQSSFDFLSECEAMGLLHFETGNVPDQPYPLVSY